jgi:hypothetical protein
MRLKRNSLTTIGMIIFMIGWVNFAIFWIVAVCIGGDAFSGKIVDGHYFVSNHGNLTEVSPAVWQYSRIHAASLCVTHPVGILLGTPLIIFGQRLKKAA